MLALILKMGEKKEIVELNNDDVRPLLESLKASIIIDSEGAPWIIDPDATLYFESYPPHFEIDCKKEE